MTREEELELLIREQRKDDKSTQAPERHPGVHHFHTIRLDEALEDDGGGLPETLHDFIVGVEYDFDSLIEAGDYELQGEIVKGGIFSHAHRGAHGSRRPIKHGTRDGYTNRGCRCALCRRAFADAHREYTHRTGRRKPMEVELARRAESKANKPHGTETKYGYGCRCDECRAAATRARKARLQKAAAA